MMTCTYAVAKKAAITLKISVSLFVVSSNPGVSMRVMLLPSRVNLSVCWTSTVQDLKPIPTPRLESLARLMNWRQSDETLLIIAKYAALTVDFPLPVAPMTLLQRLGWDFNKRGLWCTHAIMTAGPVAGVFLVDEKEASWYTGRLTVVTGGKGAGRSLLVPASSHGAGGL